MRTGDLVSDFDALTDTGERVRLSELTADGPVVLFFYPKAATSGCTAEACHFRDLSEEFAALGATRVGISRDDVADQRSFAEEHDFDFPLLSDSDGSIAKQFGAKRPGPLWSKRETFVIGADRSLLGTVASESDMRTHADTALEILRNGERTS